MVKKRTGILLNFVIPNVSSSEFFVLIFKKILILKYFVANLILYRMIPNLLGSVILLASYIR